jgi:hypothetical protein
MSDPPKPVHGRGATTNPVSRYAAHDREAADDGWWHEEDPLAATAAATELGIDRSRRVISYNQSPDLPFDRTVNPYRGCCACRWRSRGCSPTGCGHTIRSAPTRC